jgi:CHAD domain-containing protein
VAYRLKRKESVRNGIRRIASDVLETAAQNLRTGGDDVAHTARRRLKMTRAVLRLVGPALDAAHFDRENQALRDVGRVLSPLRDADVFVAVLGSLAELEHSLGREKTGFPQLAALAKADQRRVRRTLIEEGAIAQARKDLIRVRDRVDDWATRDLGGSTIVTGLRASYKRALEAGRSAARSQNDDRWHEWRKRVKDLWYHLRLVRGVWPAVLDGAIDELDRLDKSLGEDHDLVIITTRLRSVSHTPALRHELNRLRPLVQRKRHDLRQQARDQAKILFNAKPRVFGRQFEACWTAWRS